MEPSLLRHLIGESSQSLLVEDEVEDLPFWKRAPPFLLGAKSLQSS